MRKRILTSGGGRTTTLGLLPQTTCYNVKIHQSIKIHPTVVAHSRAYVRRFKSSADPSPNLALKTRIDLVCLNWD